jgi:predicted ester cyclase
MPSPKEALTAAIERWNAGDLDGYLELYDDRIRLHGYTPEPIGKQEIRGFYEGMFAAFEKPQIELHEVFGEGDALAVRATMTGRHVGELMGVPATGAATALPTITIMHFDGDKVVERYAVADMLGLMVQLGAVPAPA